VEVVRITVIVVVAAVCILGLLAWRAPDPAATRAGLSLGERVLLGGGCTSAVVTLAFITALAASIW
jgi:hypothetical protein